jgi:hypothetical protein
MYLPTFFKLGNEVRLVTFQRWAALAMPIGCWGTFPINYLNNFPHRTKNPCFLAFIDFWAKFICPCAVYFA